MFQRFISFFKNISRKSKIIILLTAGVVFLSALSFVVYFRFFADNLIKFAPDDSLLYAHFSLPALKDSAPLEPMINRAFKSISSTDLPFNDVEREIAFIAEDHGNGLAFSAIIKTSRPKKMAEFLAGHNLAYRFLSRNVLAVAGSNDELDGFRKNRQNQIALRAKNKFLFGNSLSVYFNRDFFNDFAGDSLAMIFRSSFNSDIFLSAKLKPQGLLIFAGGKEFITLGVRSAKPFDLALSSSDFKSLLGRWEAKINASPAEAGVWRDYLLMLKNQFAFDWSSDFIQNFFNRKAFLLIRRNPEKTGWFFNANDFYFSVGLAGALKPEEIVIVENILKSIVANQFPRQKITRLQDGTKIIELASDISGLNFTDDSGRRALAFPDGSGALFYQLSAGKLIAANSRAFFNEAPASVADSYFFIKSSFIADSSIGGFLKGFDYLEAGK